MWNFCRHSEITAMRASGITFLIIVRPLLAVAAVLAVAVTLINEFYAPWASERARDLREARFQEVSDKAFEDIPFYNQPAGRVWRINRMSAANPNLLEGVRLSCDRPDGSRLVDITGSKAEYLDGMWWFFYPKYQYFDELNNPIENPTPTVAAMPLRAFPDLDERPRDFLLMNKAWEYYTVRDMYHYLATHPHLTRSEVASKTFDIHARLAAPFSCLIITLFAIPAGVATGRQSVFKGVIIAVALFFAFYAVSIGCMVLAKNALVPAIRPPGSAICAFWRSVSTSSTASAKNFSLQRNEGHEGGCRFKRSLCVRLNWVVVSARVSFQRLGYIPAARCSKSSSARSPPAHPARQTYALQVGRAPLRPH
jgi:lipopolysaccharide export system permease protein